MSESPAGEFQRRCARLAARFAGGQALRRQSNRSAQFDRTDYVPGDDYRRIDWNLCARHDELRTLPPAGHDNRFVYVLIDCSRSMAAADPNKFQVARDWACAVASIALAGGAATVGAAALSQRVEAELRPMQGRRHAEALVKFFAALEPQAAATDLLSAVRGFVNLRRPAGLTLVVSDFLDPGGFAPALDLLRRAHFEPLLVHVVSPADAEPRLQGALELTDAETGATRRLVARPMDLVRYRRHFRRFSAALESYSARHRLGWLRIDTARGANAALQQALRVFARPLRSGRRP